MPEAQCGDCMYRQEEDYCIRKKEYVKEEETCGHCVRIEDRHSLAVLIDKIVSIFSVEIDGNEK